MPNPDKNTPSATMTPGIGSSALAQPLAATVSFRLTESQAEKCGLGDRWRAALQKRKLLQARKLSAKEQLQEGAKKLLAIAEAKELSQREISRRAGLSWGAFRRCRDGQNDPVIWLPKVQEALDRVLRAKHD